MYRQSASPTSEEVVVRRGTLPQFGNESYRQGISWPKSKADPSADGVSSSPHLAHV
jgi:hypothetical protein